MFSTEQKKIIAEAVEKVLLELKHSEISPKNPKLSSNIDGVEEWPWTETIIKPNWINDDRT